ncbi:unnamed protein product [Brassica oleracea]
MVSLDDEEMQQWMVKSALLAHQQLFRQLTDFVRIPLEQAGGVALLICITTSIMLVRQVVTASDAALTQKIAPAMAKEHLLTADNKDSSSVETHLQSSLSLSSPTLSLFSDALSLRYIPTGVLFHLFHHKEDHQLVQEMETSVLLDQPPKKLKRKAKEETIIRRHLFKASQESYSSSSIYDMIHLLVLLILLQPKTSVRNRSQI